MKLINFVAFFVSTKYFVAADLGSNANSIFDNPILEGDEAGQENYNGLQPGQARLGRTTYKQPSFLDVGKQKMCERCSRPAGCETGYCSWSWVCYDKTTKKGANGCRCATDSNCQSGRCSSSFVCAPLVKTGGGCALSNDCASGYCGWDFVYGTRVCHLYCVDEEDIPFMVTNVELTKEGKEHFWGYHSDNFEKEIKFLKNVRYCPDAGAFDAYRIYGQVITKEEFKEEVTAYIKSSTHFDHVFYYFHGFANDPKNSYDAGLYQKNFHDSGYLIIPFNWRNTWGTKGVGYEYDRNNSAPRAGKQLAVAIDMFDIDVPVSVMCHSMGNYVFRVMAQNVSAPKKVFENVFMVAADTRMDIFSTDFNPKAPKDKKHMVEYSNFNFNTEVDLTDIPYDELKKNGGFAITELTNHVHVAWNSGDLALKLRELMQLGGGDGLRKALGKFGGEAEAMTNLPYFKGYVTYHDYSKFGTGHNYMFSNELKDLYVAEKPQLDVKLLEQHVVKEE